MIFLERILMFNIECIDFDENIYKRLLKTSTGKPIKARINVYPHYHDVISNINVTELKNDIDKMVSSYHLFDNFEPATHLSRVSLCGQSDEKPETASH